MLEASVFHCDIMCFYYSPSDVLISLSSAFPFVRGEVLPANFSPPHLIVDALISVVNFVLQSFLDK